MEDLSKRNRENKNASGQDSASRENSYRIGKIRILLVVILMLIGSGILLYPTISNLWNEYIHFISIGEYEEKIEELTDTEKDELIDAARAYNAQHKENIILDAWKDSSDYTLKHPYDTLLMLSGDGMMGYIEIPRLKEKMAIYHGISAEVLEKGVGHIEGTSLPVGGDSTHVALSAHRGLPSAKLFTDLDKVIVGDQFYIHIVNEVFAYEVDQIKIVLPEETNDLMIVPGEDHVTLITCTPYGVNTHRMLVRGKRVPYVPPEVPTETFWEKMSEAKFAIVTLLGALLFMDILFIIFRIRRRRNKKREAREAREATEN